MDKKKKRRKGKKGEQTVVTITGGNNGSLAPSAAPTDNDAAIAATPPDLAKYRLHIEHFDLSEDARIELLRAVWLIMQSFVDRAFGHDAGQLCRKHVDKIHSEDETQIPAVIHSSNNLTTPDKHLSATFQHAGKQQTEESDIE